MKVLPRLPLSLRPPLLCLSVVPEPQKLHRTLGFRSCSSEKQTARRPGGILGLNLHLNDARRTLFQHSCGEGSSAPWPARPGRRPVHPRR